jgi:WD40 repeat protein
MYLISLTFSPDGKTLASGQWTSQGWGGQSRLWEVPSGRELKPVVTGQRTFGLCFSPDGKLLATVHPLSHGMAPTALNNVICLWDRATGRQVHVLQGHQFEAGDCAFSPDGKLLASAGYARTRAPGHRIPGEPDSPDLSDALHLWDVATGAHLRQIPGDPVVTRPGEGKLRWVSNLHFTPDGKGLVSAEGNDVILYETATGKVRLRLKGHQDGVVGTAFLRGGRILLSVSQDDTVLIWDVTGRLHKGQLRPIILSSSAVEKLWGELAAADAAQAYRAMWTLAAAPESTVPFLYTKLRPIPLLNPGRIEKLLADLDDPRFKTRTQAVHGLEELGELAEPALRKALANKPSLEVRYAASRLLEVQAKATLPPDRLQVMRAIETLEQIGSPAAQELLKTLGNGAAEARLTQDARGSLERLARNLSSGASKNFLELPDAEIRSAR